VTYYSGEIFVRIFFVILHAKIRIFSVDIPSRLIESAVNELAKLPGVGKRTALRFVLHILRQEPGNIRILAESLTRLRTEIKLCKVCYSLSDHDICDICSHPSRNRSLICVVEDIRDMMAVESTGQFKGVFHVLGGLISPIDGIGPDKLKISELLIRIQANAVEEVIMALPATVEGDTTGFYLFRQLQSSNMKVTTLSKGIAIGDQLEYADEVTLGRSLLNRIPFEETIVRT
jgi:recombination protein RecR